MKALTIRRLRPSDAEALYRILSDRQVMRYLEPPYDRLQTEQFLREAGLAEPPLVYGAEEDGRLLGYVIYHAYDPDSMELGWVLSPDCWGKGYASRLTDRLVELAHRAGASRSRLPPGTSLRKRALPMWAAPTGWRYTACRPTNNDPREEPSGSSFLRFHQLPAENFVGFDGFWKIPRRTLTNRRQTAIIKSFIK